MTNKDKLLHTLIPFEDFKTLLGIDDREDKLARFCLVTTTLSIERYCMRRLLRKTNYECKQFTGDLLIPIREYPVLTMNVRTYGAEQSKVYGEEKIDPKFYRVIPDCGTEIDAPFFIELSPKVRIYRDLTYIKVVYSAGYAKEKVPADLASACLEYAAWNMSRYPGRRFGVIGNFKKSGESFEMSMPENVISLLEPYRRKTI